MNCAKNGLLLHAYADDELDVTNSLEIESHLKTCTACAAEVKSLHALKSALRQSPLRYGAPDSLRKGVRQIARASGKSSEWLAQSLLLWKWLAFSATSVAVLALLFRPAGISGHDQLLDEAVGSHVRSLMVEHLTDVASSDQHTVKPWFDGKVDFAPNVKDFAPQGFPLVGGRLDYLNGRPVAALVYRRNKHFINVFIWPESNAGSSKTVVRSRRGFSVINLEGKELHYCLVSDLNQQELNELANLVRQ